MLGPHATLQQDLDKARRSELKWQRECARLIEKLDKELNRNEELTQQYENAVLKNKELLRDIEELKEMLEENQQQNEYYDGHFNHHHYHHNRHRYSHGHDHDHDHSVDQQTHEFSGNESDKWR